MDNMNLIKRKNWDSDFFGYEIFEVKSENFQAAILEKELIDLNNSGVVLVYLITQAESKDLETLGCRLVDIKVLYSKEVEKEYTATDKKIHSFPPVNSHTPLIDLALDSGKYSRFKLDAGFLNQEFEKLYTEWIKRSVNSEIAHEVLVFRENNENLGMVTIAIDNRKAWIGLISVREGHRGKNIGNQLLNAANNYDTKLDCANKCIYSKTKLPGLCIL